MSTEKEKSKKGSKSTWRLGPKQLALIGLGLAVLAVLFFLIASALDSDEVSDPTSNEPLPLDDDGQPLVIDPGQPLEGSAARNNQRHLDVAKVMGLLRQTIGGDGQIPAGWSDLSPRLDRDGLGLYDQAQINSQAPDWLVGLKAGDLIDFAAASSYHPVPRLDELTAAIGPDQILIFSQAACNWDNNGLEAGGRRDLAVAYRLEGQADLVCVDA